MRQPSGMRRSPCKECRHRLTAISPGCWADRVRVPSVCPGPSSRSLCWPSRWMARAQRSRALSSGALSPGS
jgi:hypothetical protein